MTKLSNIDIAYEFLKAKNNKAKFDEICKAVFKQNKVEEPQKNMIMASLYSSLVLDNRFSLTPDGSWALRSNLKFEDVKKQYANLIIEATKKKVKPKDEEEHLEDEEDLDSDDLDDDEDIEEDEDEDEEDEDGETK